MSKASSITIKLSDQPKIREYLDATTDELLAIAAKREEVQASLPGLKEALAAAEREYLEAERSIRQALEIAQCRIVEAYREWVAYSDRSSKEDRHTGPLWDAYKKEQAETSRLRNTCPDATEKGLAQSALSSAESTLDKKHGQIEDRISLQKKHSQLELGTWIGIIWSTLSR
jgi:hypothetical protein